MRVTTAIRKVTPIIVPSTVKNARSLCARIIESAVLIASRRFIGSGLGEGQAAVRRPWLLTRVALDHAVAQRHQALCVGCDVGLVCDHDDRLPLRVQSAEQ